MLEKVQVNYKKGNVSLFHFTSLQNSKFICVISFEGVCANIDHRK